MKAFYQIFLAGVQSTMRVWLPATLVAALLLAGPTHAQTGEQFCGDPFYNNYGPFDFRGTTAAQRAIVERVHFTPGIESMSRAGTSMFHEMAKDVAYTLGVYPNHHRALLTMRRLSERWKRDPPPGIDVPVECWFDRAVRFRPEDTVARALYAQFLGSRKRVEDAARQLALAAEFSKDNALSLFNIGLVYVELGLHERALPLAHRSAELGFTRPELANAIKAAGKWREPQARPAPAGPGQAASAATSPADRP